MNLCTRTFLAVVMTIALIFTVNLEKSSAAQFDKQKFPYSELHIQLMPEFDYPSEWEIDEPSLLVGYYGSIVNKTGEDYSGEIQVRVPTRENNFIVEFVAEFPEVGQSEEEVPFTVDEERGILSWVPSKPIKAGEIYDFVIEYYYAPLTVNGSNKSYSYSFIADNEIEEAFIIIYAPLGSENFQVDSDLEGEQQNSYGIDLYQFKLKSLQTGDEKEFTFSYNKADHTSTIEQMNKQGAPHDSVHAGVNPEISANATVSNQGGFSVTTSVIILTIATLIAMLLIFLGYRIRRG